jgi:hypothetical protein
MLKNNKLRLLVEAIITESNKRFISDKSTMVRNVIIGDLEKKTKRLFIR